MPSKISGSKSPDLASGNGVAFQGNTSSKITTSLLALSPYIFTLFTVNRVASATFILSLIKTIELKNGTLTIYISFSEKTVTIVLDDNSFVFPLNATYIDLLENLGVGPVTIVVNIIFSPSGVTYNYNVNFNSTAAVSSVLPKLDANRKKIFGYENGTLLDGLTTYKKKQIILAMLAYLIPTFTTESLPSPKFVLKILNLIQFGGTLTVCAKINEIKVEIHNKTGNNSTFSFALAADVQSAIDAANLTGLALTGEMYFPCDTGAITYGVEVINQ
jgi:hypothetical protein